MNRNQHISHGKSIGDLGREALWFLTHTLLAVIILALVVGAMTLTHPAPDALQPKLLATVLALLVPMIPRPAKQHRALRLDLRACRLLSPMRLGARPAHRQGVVRELRSRREAMAHLLRHPPRQRPDGRRRPLRRHLDSPLHDRLRHRCAIRSCRCFACSLSLTPKPFVILSAAKNPRICFCFCSCLFSLAPPQIVISTGAARLCCCHCRCFCFCLFSLTHPHPKTARHSERSEESPHFAFVVALAFAVARSLQPKQSGESPVRTISTAPKPLVLFGFSQQKTLSSHKT